MFTYIIWRIRAWLRYDHICLTPEMHARMRLVSLGFRSGSWIFIPLIALGCFIYVREEVREHCALRVPGKIIGFEEKGGRQLGPIYQYTLPSGKTYRGSLYYSWPSVAYRADDAVTVLYWESDPEGGAIGGINFELVKTLVPDGLVSAIGFQIASKLAMSETLARILLSLFLKVP